MRIKGNMCSQLVLVGALFGLVMVFNGTAAADGPRTIEIIRGTERIEVPVLDESSEDEPKTIEVIRGRERLQVPIQEEPAEGTPRTIEIIRGKEKIQVPVSSSPSPKVTDSSLEINEQNYEQEIFEAKIAVFVQFYSASSLGCKIQAPLVAEIARSYAGKVKFVTIDVDKHPALALAFNISRLPTLVVKQPGVEDVLVARGLLEHEELKRFLEEGLGPVQPSGK